MNNLPKCGCAACQDLYMKINNVAASIAWRQSDSRPIGSLPKTLEKYKKQLKEQHQ